MWCREWNWCAQYKKKAEKENRKSIDFYSDYSFFFEKKKMKLTRKYAAHNHFST